LSVRVRTQKAHMVTARGRAKFDACVLEHVHGEYGDTPLLVAAHFGHKQCVTALIEAGARCNVQDEMGWTPLILAAFLGDDTNVRGLIAAGADVDKAGGGGDGVGVTALLAATSSQSVGVNWRGQHEVVKLLLESGAERHCRDAKGLTALDHANKLAANKSSHGLELARLFHTTAKVTPRGPDGGSDE